MPFMYSSSGFSQCLDWINQPYVFRALAVLTVLYVWTTISSWREPILWLFRGPFMVKERYKKYGKHFAIRTPEAKVHFFTSPDHIRQLARQPNDVLDNMQPAFMAFQPENTMPGLKFSNFGEHTLEYHRVLKKFQAQTNTLTGLMQNIVQDILRKHICKDTKTNGWTMTSTFDLCIDIISRVSACTFVGVDPNDSELSTRLGTAALPFALECVFGAEVSRLLPKFMRRFAIKIGTKGNKCYWTLRSTIKQIVVQRLTKVSLKADLNESTNRKDYLECLLETYPERNEDTADKITNHFVMLWIASIMQPVVTMTYILHDLAAHPEYIVPLRDEIDRNRDKIQGEGSLSSLNLLDSFIKESTRMNCLESFVLRRYTVSQFQFQDGTVIPRGEVMGAPMKEIMNDHKIYPDPHIFNPYRFAPVDVQKPNATLDYWPPAHNSNANDLAETSPTYLFWAYGRHTCPGRYYASHKLKLIAMEVVSQWDIKVDTAAVKTINWRSTTFPTAANQLGFRARREGKDDREAVDQEEDR